MNGAGVVTAAASGLGPYDSSEDLVPAPFLSAILTGKITAGGARKDRGGNPVPNVSTASSFVPGTTASPPPPSPSSALEDLHGEVGPLRADLVALYQPVNSRDLFTVERVADLPNESQFGRPIRRKHTRYRSENEPKSCTHRVYAAAVRRVTRNLALDRAWTA
jgi:hypothetical protein